MTILVYGASSLIGRYVMTFTESAPDPLSMSLISLAFVLCEASPDAVAFASVTGVFAARAKYRAGGAHLFGGPFSSNSVAVAFGIAREE